MRVVYEHEYVSVCMPEHVCLQVPGTCVNVPEHAHVCVCVGVHVGGCMYMKKK